MPSVRYGPSGRPICPKCPEDSCFTIYEHARIYDSSLPDKHRSFLTFLEDEFPKLVPRVCIRRPNAFMLFRSKYNQKQKAATEAEDSGSVFQHDQRAISQDAASAWNAMSDKERRHYEVWANQLKGVIVALQAILAKEDKKRNDSPTPRKSTPTALRKPRIHSHLPSPPVSDIVSDSDMHSVQDDDRDDSYLPRKSSRRSVKPSRKSTKTRSARQLLSPQSVKELSPEFESDSLSPTLVPDDLPLFDVPVSSIQNLTLNEFNSSSSRASSPPSSPTLSIHGEFFDQIAVGYSLEEHRDNLILDWNQADLFPDHDYNPADVQMLGLAEDIIDTMESCSEQAELAAQV